jgi:hypothetical protein
MSRPPLQCGCLLGPQDVQECVCGIVQNRANLAATLKDARTVVGKLERFMGVVVQALFLFLYLMIWQVGFAATLPDWSCSQTLQQAEGVLDRTLNNGQVLGQLLYL